MHAGTVDAEYRLRHKGGVLAVFLRQRLDRQLEGHDIVGCLQRFGILEVDLMLPCRHLMVRGLDLKAHVLQRHADLAPRALAAVERTQIKIAGLVVRLRDGIAGVVRLEEEKLAFRARR